MRDAGADVDVDGPEAAAEAALVGAVALRLAGLGGRALVEGSLAAIGEATGAAAVGLLETADDGALTVWRAGEAGCRRTPARAGADPERTLRRLQPVAGGSVVCVPARGAGGDVCGTVAALAPDAAAAARAGALLRAFAGWLGAALEGQAASAAMRRHRAVARDLGREWYWRTDAGGRFVEVSDAVTAVTGGPAAALLGRTRVELFGSRTRAANHAVFERLEADLAAGRPFRDVEYVIVRADQPPRRVRISGAPWRGADGRVAGFHGVGEDVTDLRAAEAASQRNLQRLTDAIEAMPAGFALFDAEDRLVLCNAVYRALHRGETGRMLAEGVGFEQIIRNGVAAGLYDDDTARRDPEAFVAARLARHRNPDGKPFELRLNNGRWFAIAERRTTDGGVVIVRTDITRRKDAERRLLDAIDNVPVGFLMCGPDDRLVLSNRRYRDLYPELDGALTPGTPFAALCRICGEAVDAAGLEMGLDAWLAERLDAFRNPGPPRRTTTLTGKTILVSEARTDDGSYVAAHVDISEIVLLQERLQVETRRAEAALAARGRFMANMSHDLRTPLNAVIGLAELMRYESQGPLNAAYRDYAAQIKAAGEFLLSLIVDIMDMARIEAGRMGLEPEPVALAEVAGDVVAMLAPIAARKGLELRVDGLDAAPPVMADPRRLKQILQNLVANAVKFSSRGRVTVGAAVEGDAVRLHVADEGPGMTAEEASAVVAPFTRLRGVEGQEGHGLGLSIVKAMVELHGGALRLDSEPGRGTVASFTLPRLS